MKGWSFLKIKDYPIQIIDGDRGANYPTKEEFLEDGHCLFLNTGNVTLSGFKFDEKVFVTEEKHKKLRKGHLQRGDIVLTTRGTIGNVAFYDESIKYGVIRINSGMLILRPDLNKLNAQFFYGLVRSSIFQQQADLFRYGAAQPQLPIGTLNHIRLPLPPLPTQKKIAGILSAYDDAIENNLRRIKLLEEMAQITYEEWFVRLRFPGHTTIPINPATGLPEGWHTEALGKNVKFIKGKKLDETFLEQQEGLLKIMLLDSLESGNYKYTNPSNHTITERGDLVMCMDGARSSYVFYAECGVVGSTMAKIHSETLPSSLLYLFFKSHLESLQTNNTGAAIPHANKSFINNLNFLVPTKEILSLWESKLTPINSQVWNLRDQNQRLREVRDILLPRLMTGVIDAEKYQPENFLKKN